MKITCVVLLAFILSFELHAQTNFQLSSLKENSFKNKDAVNSTRLMLGVGIINDLNYHGIKHLVEINANINIYQALYLNIGTELYEYPRNYHGDQTFGLFLAPNLNVFVDNKKIFAFIGAGFYLFHPLPIPESGVTLFSRGEYVISKKFSAGLELKYVTRIKGARDKYISGNAYIAFRF